MKEPYKTYTLNAFVMISFFLAFITLAAFFDKAYADYSPTLGSGTSAILEFGQDASTGGDSDKVAAKFTTVGVGDVVTAHVILKKVNTSSDNVIVSVFATDGTKPTGSTLGDSDAVAISSFSTGCASVDFTFSTPVTISAATEYWLVLSRTGTLDNTNRPQVCGTSSGGDHQVTIHRTDTGVWQDGGSLDTMQIGGSVDITEGGGGGGGGEATTTEPTVINNPNQDLFNGIVLFLVSFFGTVWLFRRRT